MPMSAAITVVVNGSIVAGAAPARIVGGRVVAPLTPVVVRLATRVSYDPATATVSIQRGTTRIVVPVAFVENDEPYIALAPVVQRLGGNALFDGRTKTLVINVELIDPIATPQPYLTPSPDGSTPVLSPAPALPTPRDVQSTEPRPRRTAIPAAPSEPVVPTPEAGGPTGPRR